MYDLRDRRVFKNSKFSTVYVSENNETLWRHDIYVLRQQLNTQPHVHKLQKNIYIDLLYLEKR